MVTQQWMAGLDQAALLQAMLAPWDKRLSVSETRKENVGRAHVPYGTSLSVREFCLSDFNVSNEDQEPHCAS